VPAGGPVEIVHSPLGRAAETAQAVAAAIAQANGTDGQVPLRADRGLMETAQGEWEGLTHEVIRERWPEILATWRRRPLEAWAPGGESLLDVADRTRVSLTAIMARLAEGGAFGSLDRPQVPGYRDPISRGSWTIVVGHDGALKVLVLTLLGIPLGCFWVLPFALAGITVIEVRGGRPTLRAHNLTEHLAPLLDERAQVASAERERTGAL
jgi:broad specificity phosphatase PhoE